jgi:hypothetical protein
VFERFPLVANSEKAMLLLYRTRLRNFIQLVLCQQSGRDLAVYGVVGIFDFRFA